MVAGYQLTPTARQAKDLRELILLCREEPGAAAQHLHGGMLEPWLDGIGRCDLGALTREIRQGGLPGPLGVNVFVDAAASLERDHARAPEGGERTPPLENGFERITRSIHQAGRRLAGLPGRPSSIGRQLLGVGSMLAEQTVTMTFGGAFKSGKSSLINALLEFPLLPVNELPETGAMCILRTGDRDIAEIVLERGRRPIGCNTRAIQSVITLLSEEGERRTDVQQVERLEISLRTTAIPPGVRWVDPPGINDTGEMDECARRAAREADLLFWILSGRQPLSEPEVEFLAGCVEELGPPAVIFLLNAFLPEDTIPNWERFLERNVPFVERKVQHMAAEMGFEGDLIPQLLPVSGRGMASGSESDFGGAKLRELLSRCSTLESPRIRQVRLYRTARFLRPLIADLQQEWSAALAHEKQSRRQAIDNLERMQHNQSCFSAAVQSALDEFFRTWNTGADACIQRVAAGITSEQIRRDGSYSNELNAGLGAAAASAFGPLEEAIRTAASSCHQRPLSGSQSEKLRAMLTPPPVTVMVPSANRDMKQVAAAAGGGLVAGSILPGIGHVVAPLAAAGAALWNSGKEARLRDSEAARNSVGMVAEYAKQWVVTRREQALAMILDACVEPPPTTVKTADTTRREELEQSLVLVASLAYQAAALARGDHL